LPMQRKLVLSHQWREENNLFLNSNNTAQISIVTYSLTRPQTMEIDHESEVALSGAQ
jgi:hypothetical protein